MYAALRRLRCAEAPGTIVRSRGRRFAGNCRLRDTIETVDDSIHQEVKIVPLYVYRCKQCGQRLEKIQHFKSKPETVCPKCQGALERVLTAPSFKFKGSGWYVNDYGGKSAEPAASTPPPPPAPAAAKPPCGGSCGTATCPVAAAAKAE